MNTVKNNTIQTTTGGGWGTTTTTTGGGKWSVTTAGTTTTSTTYPWYINPEIFHCKDVVLEDLGSVSDLLKAVQFLIPPGGLDLKNATVSDALDTWYQAMQQLKLAHEQLKTLSQLTKEFNE